jgi:predicted RNase H-like HicB family nuclease
MRYVFPAVFEQAEEGGFNVKIPDVPGCFTQGDTLAEAIYMAQDALAMMIVYYEDHGNEIPASSSLEDIKSGKAIVSYVLADTDQWRRNNDNRAVKKTLSIPSWLNAKASRAGVNFTQVLQEALVSKLS